MAKTLQDGSPDPDADKTRNVGLDLEFHGVLAVASKNPVFSLLLHTIMEIEADLVIPIHRFSHSDHCSVDMSHQEIYDAILAGDGDRAADAMRRHLLDIQERKLKARSPLMQSRWILCWDLVTNRSQASERKSRAQGR